MVRVKLGAKSILTVGSLFSGCGGMDFGFEAAGMKTIWMCERDVHCIKLLRNKWPGIRIYHDVKDLLYQQVVKPNVIIGGDPCPKHSNARGGCESRHPDLSGYYLAVVGRLRPQWVVRENVLAPTVDDFAIAMEALGYGVAVVRVNASAFTNQNREREFVVGCCNAQALRGFSVNTISNSGYSSPMCDESGSVKCLTTRENSSYRNCYVWDAKYRIFRAFLPEERERLAGLPDAWTAGFSTATRNKMCGNAVVPAVAKEIADRIVLASGSLGDWTQAEPEVGIARILKRVLPIWRV